VGGHPGGWTGREGRWTFAARPRGLAATVVGFAAIGSASWGGGRAQKDHRRVQELQSIVKHTSGGDA